MSRAAVAQSSSDSFEAMQQMSEGYKSYASLYKASQIGQAMINATQSAAAAVQVRKIASAKMYTGGMIPGGSKYFSHL